MPKCSNKRRMAIIILAVTFVEISACKEIMHVLTVQSAAAHIAGQCADLHRQIYSLLGVLPHHQIETIILGGP